ncbi:MAG: hypothetical protein IKX33_12095, partial [Prevotella sp.]|nr:hypothetical protein [Prevotella sp.]
ACRAILKSVPNNNSPLAIDKHNIFEENSDVIIMGASQAKHNFDPRILTDSLGMKAYVAGQDGIDVIQNYIYLKAIFDRKPPKVVILEVFSAYLDGSMKYRISNLNMWYGLSEPVTEYFDSQASWQEKLKLKSNLYIYNGLLQHLVRMKVRAEDAIDGYVPMTGQYKGSFFTNNKFETDAEELKYLDMIVDLCKSKHTRLFMVRSPIFLINDTYNAWLADYCKKNNLPLLNHSADKEMTDHPELFREMLHLNKNGADKFTRIIASELKAMLK